MVDDCCHIVGVKCGESPVSRLTELCDGADGLSLAVGYLFFDGLAPLIPRLKQLRKVQLLIGNVVNRLTEEQIRESQLNRPRQIPASPEEMFAKGLRDERNRTAVETALNLRRIIDAMPRNRASRALVLDFATLIAEGTLLVRLLTSRRLHAKTAIVTYPHGDSRSPGVGIIGSSNLTFASSSLGAQDPTLHPADLDVEVCGQENLNYLTDWFGAHWAEAQDFQKELFEELGQTWPLQDDVTAQ